MAQTPQDKMARPGHFSGIPHAEIKSKQAVFTLSQLHAELAGKLMDNKRAAIKIRTAMMQVEAVVQNAPTWIQRCGYRRETPQ
jgi:hypothetical protein